jgi:hypothetical protein
MSILSNTDAETRERFVNTVESMTYAQHERHGSFANLLAECVIRECEIKQGECASSTIELRNLALVALVLDARVIEELAHCSRSLDAEYAVIKHEHTGEGDPKVIVLYTVRAMSIAHAFYMMCADSCDRYLRSGRDHVSELDPHYRTMKIDQLLSDVAERAEWNVADLWDAFCDFRYEIYPYEIVPATMDHYGYQDFVFRS